MLSLGKVGHSIKRAIYMELITRLMAKGGWRPRMGVPPDVLSGSGHFGYDEESQIKAAIAKIADNTLATFERLASLWQQVRYLDRYSIPGDFVECGVWKGGAVGMMALAHRASTTRPSRTIHLFDSFEGLPEPCAEKDGNEATRLSKGRASGNLTSIRECVGTLAENRELLEGTLHYPSPLLKYHVGWFQESIPKASLESIALLRLDGDWYESTKVCLVNLYPKVVKAGVIIIDDYGHWEGCRRAVDEFVSTLEEPVLLHHIDYSGRYWIKIL